MIRKQSLRRLLRQHKRFGRCSVPGHASNCFCEVCEEIQTTAISRAEEKRFFDKEVNEQLKEMNEE